MMKTLKRIGCTFKPTKKGMFLYHPKAKQAYLMHYGEKSIHEVRRWIKRELKIDINV